MVCLETFYMWRQGLAAHKFLRRYAVCNDCFEIWELLKFCKKGLQHVVVTVDVFVPAAPFISEYVRLQATKPLGS